MWKEIFTYFNEIFVHAFVTILLVDQLLAWREKKRWSEARALFNGLIEIESQSIILAWKEWLSSLPEMGQGLPESATTTLLTMGYLAVDGSEGMLKLFLGTPVGSKLEKFTRESRKTITEIKIYLVPFLAARIPSTNDASWKRLSKKIEPPVRSLEELVRTYAPLLHPTLAAKVLRLTGEVKNLTSDSYQNILSRKEDLDKSGQLVTALSLGSALQNSIELSSYLYREGRPSWVEKRIDGLENVRDIIQALWEEFQDWRSRSKTESK